MAKRGIALDRILRVRTLQLGLVQAAEIQAHEKLASEDSLRNRIAQLVANVAPEESSAQAFSFIAAAHFRERLNQSAAAAEARLQAAADNLARASDATREARRDQSAIEKLIAREDQAAVIKAMRELEEVPPTRRNRHDPC
jgi:hypothetical protein